MTTPELKWAQRSEKVFVTFECLETSDVTVELTEGLISLKAKAKGKEYCLENMPLWGAIDADESKWFRNDRCACLPCARCVTLTTIPGLIVPPCDP